MQLQLCQLKIMDRQKDGIWKFNNSTGTYRASISQTAKNVTIDNFMRISLSGFGTAIANIWQADNVARLVGGLSEAITFTPTALTGGVATLRFNDTTGAVKSTISQRTDGAIRITGSNGMEMVGYTGTASGLSCTPG
eukprot:TRINITY_DN28458_c0_g1_i1.p1 TRINITY_DN28458_c0_g1~~TRINITY_DN28458_c0_g1_i1.p1  ORF type:complete len:137 (-),score=11.25 TRINITY_DN28458_c0_g1_i1:104-514(-)